MANWSVTVIDRQRKRGMAPVHRAPQEPFAERDGLAIGGRTGEITCTDAAGHVRWTRPVPGTPNTAHISSGRVLVTTSSIDYHAWGHLGPAYLLDLADGAPVAELRGERGAALGAGRFVLGLVGYDRFHTWQYDRDGNCTDTWRGYGHYVVGTGLRVVEVDRPTRSRVVRLLPGGVIERSALPLTGSRPCEPVVLHDGTILVLDAGMLRAVGRDLSGATLAELLPVPGEEDWRFVATLERTAADRLTAVIEERDPERGTYVTHTWTLALHAPR
ncbi:hypothetical protein [Kitasatospora sp. NPDC096140]|uniref:hypothetical protein n=1 Tax=Kitasatospora sp. NPDC096140 TaxID=3155425 RepID=UPI00332B9476